MNIDNLKSAQIVDTWSVQLAIPRRVSGSWVVDTEEDSVKDPHNHAVWYFVRVGAQDILTDKETFYTTRALTYTQDNRLFQINENDSIPKPVIDMILKLIDDFDAKLRDEKI